MKARGAQRKNTRPHNNNKSFNGEKNIHYLYSAVNDL